MTLLPRGVGCRGRDGRGRPGARRSARAGSARPGSSTRWPISASATGGQVLRGGATRRSARSSSSRSSTRSPRHSPDCSATRSRPTLRDHEAAWVSLVPDLAAVLAERAGSAGRPRPPAPGDVRRGGGGAAPARGAPGRSCSSRRPAGRRCGDGRPARLPRPAARDVAGPARRRRPQRGRDGRRALGDRARRIPLGPLGPAAVATLAAAAGLGPRGGQVMARTAGHTLSVVECLRALAGGDTGVPASLVAGRAGPRRPAGPRGRSVVEAGAVLRRRLDPRLLAGLTELSEVAATRHGEELTRAGLFVRSGAVYEFANDLFQECVYAALPAAVAAAYHRRAADLTSDRPEVMATHAHAVGDDARAARAGCSPVRRPCAGRRSRTRRTLVERCLAVPDWPGRHGRGRCWCAGGCTRPARAGGCHPGHRRGARLGPQHRGAPARAGRAARPRWGRGVGAQLAADELLGPLEDGVRLAAELGDRRAEADFGSRLAVLEASRLRLSDARRAGRGGRAGPGGGVAGRCGAGARRPQDRRVATSGTRAALADAVAGARAARAGAPGRLAAAVGGLRVGLRAGRARAVGRGRGRVLQSARPQPAQRLPGLRRLPPGYDGWLARLAGDLDEARRLGRRAVEETSAVDHPWWHSWAAGLLAATLVETGETAEAEPWPGPGWPR